MKHIKKFLALTLCGTMLCGTLGSLSPAQAAAGTDSTIQEVVSALGIITGDASGNLNLTANVTRAQFAKMLVCASTYKDTVSAVGNSSPFTDVPYTYWAANYIKTAVAQGWITGYLDGTFRPNNTVTCAEAATAVLKLLGYTSSDFSGTFPHAQMALYQALNLDDGISASSTTPMSRQKCMRLFYNLLSADTKVSSGSSEVYAASLGYELDEDGNPDYDDILDQTIDGPLVMTTTLSAILSFTPTTVYRNDSVSSVSALQSYDVIYYSAERKTVWAYARRVTGTLEEVSPNRQAPTAVTVAGTAYEVSGTLATSMLGVNGGLAVGTNVTLLLGKNGEAVAAYAADAFSSELIGVVTAVDKTATYAAADGTTYTQASTTILGTDGQSYTVQAYDKYLPVGTCVMVTFSGASTSISKLATASSIVGAVSASGQKIGNTMLATDVEILDVNTVGGVKTYLSRIDGLTLTSGDVRYYEKNASGVVEKLILNDVTGDQYTYGILRSAANDTSSGDAEVTYEFQVGAATSSYTKSGTSLGSIGYSGPVQITYSDDGTVIDIDQLTQIKNITSITTTAIKNADGSHTISDTVAVYKYSNQNYYVMDRNSIDSSVYDIKAYYDKADTEGGRVRVVVMTEK